MDRISIWLLRIVAVLAASWPVNLAAQDVILTAKTGEVRIEGLLVEFDGEFYRVKTDLGVLTVDGRTVDCSGPSCPTTDDMVSKFSISGSGEAGATLVPALLEAYGLSLDGETVASELSSHGQVLAIFSNDGAEIARTNALVQSEAGSFKLLSENETVIVVSGRAPNKAEHELAAAAGKGNLLNPSQQQTLALDGLVAVVSQINPLKSVSLKDLKKIWQS